MELACRWCGEPAAPFEARVDLRLCRCHRCGLVSAWPVVSANAERQYADYYHGAILTAPMPEARYEEWLAHAEQFVGTGRLLEVGAGSGGFVRAALRRGWSVDATEISASGLEHLRSTGAQVFAGDLLAAHYSPACFDAVASIEVLEHLPEPGPHLRELARVLRPGGVLLLTTPNFDGLSRRWLGLRWRVVDPEHLSYFTPRALLRALLETGFAHAEVRARTLDVTTWRHPSVQPARFDPERAAVWRDTVNASGGLRRAKDALNVVLGLTGLGDSLLAWARR